ncbi:DUF4767 domain-containing protein [Limosilactobacillus kribbianus]|uniref:DUF4767 domain-containing protein n=1 Tax=Limosilactobacillus kribbianus TaxID=2982695 RepID=UPI002263DF0E|nr:DUF4767 domain-containing protein [Limosilactobacillus kribbianus]
MKKKSLYLMGMLVTMSLLLGGCGANSTAHHNSTSSSSSSAVTKTTTSSTSSSKTSTTHSQSAALWNHNKDAQLTTFINQSAPTMHQSYTKYDGATDLKTNPGTEYPSDFKMTTVEGDNASIGWAPSGKGNYDYNVVALYNYNGSNTSHITYAFAFHDGQPVALVDQSTNGTPNWTPTKNTDVQSNFERIADAQ